MHRMMSDFHIPVLLEESLDGLVTDLGGCYVDATFGGGGHSKAILQKLGPDAMLYAFDQDQDAIEQGFEDDRLRLIRSNFRYIGNFLRYYGVDLVDGILADLGVSSFQLDTKHKGFSFQESDLLDMRMNQLSEQTAASFLARTSEIELIEVLSEYGQVRNAKTIAKAIIDRRKYRPLNTVKELLQCVEPFVIGNRSRYLAQLFQAIRIKVNDEMGALKAFLKTSEQVLKPGGRLVVITYHSVEDRIVKHFMKRGVFSRPDFGQSKYGSYHRPQPLKTLTKKPITPSDHELRMNRRARSAKLRIAEKIKI